MNINQVTLGSLIPDAAATRGRRELDQNAFLQLLVTQLKHQNPEAPQDPGAFIAQLAQFSQLDQLIGIRQSLNELAAKLESKG